MKQLQIDVITMQRNSGMGSRSKKFTCCFIQIHKTTENSLARSWHHLFFSDSCSISFIWLLTALVWGMKFIVVISTWNLFFFSPPSYFSSLLTTLVSLPVISFPFSSSLWFFRKVFQKLLPALAVVHIEINRDPTYSGAALCGIAINSGNYFAIVIIYNQIQKFSNITLSIERSRWWPVINLLQLPLSGFWAMLTTVLFLVVPSIQIYEYGQTKVVRGHLFSGMASLNLASILG